jgi:uncharacterized membrane protein
VTWRVWPFLILVGAVPMLAGVLRLVQLAGGPAVIAADARLDPAPLVVLHIVGAAVFVVLGALQMVPGPRGRRHRVLGRMVVLAGVVVACSALAMTLLYPAKAGTGDLLFLLRLVFGSAMAAFLVLGVAAARRRDIGAHRAWMIRAYAVALAAGTQVLTETAGPALFGPGVLVHDLSSGAGWVLNLLVAEWIIRGPRRRRRSPTTDVAPIPADARRSSAAPGAEAPSDSP